MSVPDIPLAIIGPTAAGKSALAMAIAAVDDRVELISADSMQVYRGMDIGTAKPSRDEQAAVPHHLIDILDPWDAYTVSQFVVDVDRVTADIRSRGKIPVMVGGTGLYVRSIVDDMEIPPQFPDVKAELEADPDTDGMHRRLAELDPVGAERMDSNNRRRVIRALEVTVGSGRPFSSFGPGMDRYKPSRVNQIACDRPRPSLDERIHRRYDVQMERGIPGRSPSGRGSSQRHVGQCPTSAWLQGTAWPHRRWPAARSGTGHRQTTDPSFRQTPTQLVPP